MSSITTHILDTSSGRPAAGVGVELYRRDGDGWARLNAHRTDNDGRLGSLFPESEELTVGTYRLRFLTGAYYASRDLLCFYPRVDIIFSIEDPAEHFHVPLLLSPFGYSTYRGS